jgi:hypothetical protein
MIKKIGVRDVSNPHLVGTCHMGRREMRHHGP